MATIRELIREEMGGAISFGDYTLDAKAKLELNVAEQTYKVKTFSEITKLECNDVFVYESVPGTAVTGFVKDDTQVSFEVEGPEDAQITVGLEPDMEYEVQMDGKSAGTIKTNLGGKLSVSVELADVDKVQIKIVRC